MPRSSYFHLRLWPTAPSTTAPPKTTPQKTTSPSKTYRWRSPIPLLWRIPLRRIPAAITISIKSKYQLSLSPLEKKNPTYETKTRRNQEEKNTPLRRVLRLLGVIALVRHCESLFGFAVRGFVEGIGDDVWEKLVKSDAWCGVVSCVARADPRPTTNKRTSSSDNLALPL